MRPGVQRTGSRPATCRALFTLPLHLRMISNATEIRSRLAQSGAHALIVLLGAFTAQVHAQLTTYRGACDASAAAGLDAEHFVVANDENDTLSIYRGERVVGTLDLAPFLGTRAGRESDIEAAAAIGSRIYWITSHGRSRRAVAEPSRQRLFATEVRSGPTPMLEPVGQPYAHLLRDLESAESLQPYNLGEAARLAPEANGGLNIEGLAATPDGRLLIGLRSPLVDRRAVVISLNNPDDVIHGRRAELGLPVTLDLDGRGIRSIDLVGAAYWIVGGPTGDTGSFAVYRWSGKGGDPVRPFPIELGDLRPEALFAIPQSNQIRLLSDDGGRQQGGVECKRLPLARQTFRGLTLTP